MITVYDKKTSKGNFNNNGLGVLKDTISCKITNELNGDYSLELVYPAHSDKAQYLNKWNIIKADGQLFRIYNVQRYEKNGMYINVRAKHIFYDMAFFFIEKAEAVNKTIDNAIKMSFPTDVLNLFDISAQSGLNKVFPYSIEEQNCVKALFSLLNIYGYEIVRDNFSIKIVDRVGNENGITVKYGKNILGIEAIEDTSELITKIYPVGKSGLKLPERYIQVDNINDTSLYIPYPIIKKVEFPEVEDIQTLREMAKAYLDKNSKPKVTVEIDFLSLYKTEEYKQYEGLTKVNIGDTVNATHFELGIKTNVRVIKIEKNILNTKDIKIGLGEAKQTILKEIDKTSIYDEIKRISQKSTDISTIYKSNSTDRIFTSTSSELIFEFENFMSDNITMDINIVGEATEDLVIEITMFRDGIELPLKPKQKVGKGENVLSIPYVLTQVKEGVHNLSFRVKTSLGEFRVNKGQFVLILQGKSLEGGIVAEPPYPQKVETIVSNILFGLQNKNTIKDKIDSVVISNTAKIQNNETVNLVQSKLQTNIIDSYFVNFKIAKTYIELLNVDYIIDTTIYNLENQENILITQKKSQLIEENLGNGYIYRINLIDKTKIKTIERVELI